MPERFFGLVVVSVYSTDKVKTKFRVIADKMELIVVINILLHF